jgi:hypothetical protein
MKKGYIFALITFHNHALAPIIPMPLPTNKKANTVMLVGGVAGLAAVVICPLALPLEIGIVFGVGAGFGLALPGIALTVQKASGLRRADEAVAMIDQIWEGVNQLNGVLIEHEKQVNEVVIILEGNKHLENLRKNVQNSASHLSLCMLLCRRLLACNECKRTSGFVITPHLYL